MIARALLSWLVLAAGARAFAGVQVGDPFPAISAASVVPLTDRAVPPTERKVVLVDFWASWCAPCKASFPALAKLQADYAARGLVVIGVSVDDKAGAAAAFAKKLSPPFATLHDREKRLVREVAVPAMPTSYLVGRDGRVRFVHAGFEGPATVRALRQQIETLLAETDSR